MSYTLLPYSNAQDWCHAIVESMREAVLADLNLDNNKNRAVLSLSGGGTPLPIYQNLAREASIDWQRVVLIPGDDRCIAHSDALSNFAQFQKAFTDAKGVQFQAITSADGNFESSLEIAKEVGNQYREAFSATVLGLGNDMHTASLFPNSTQLAQAIDPNASDDFTQMIPNPLPPEAPYPRISMTANRLLRSKKILLVIQGESKRKALQNALRVNDPMQAPILSILNADGAHVEIHWCA